MITSGMGHHRRVVDAMCEAARATGAGAGGTRNISGTSSAIVELEREIADLHGKESALVFTSGYWSNVAGIATIAKLAPGLSDFCPTPLNHNSMIEGVRAAAEPRRSGGTTTSTTSNMSCARRNRDRAKLIVF